MAKLVEYFALVGGLVGVYLLVDDREVRDLHPEVSWPR